MVRLLPILSAVAVATATNHPGEESGGGMGASAGLPFALGSTGSELGAGNGEKASLLGESQSKVPTQSGSSGVNVVILTTNAGGTAEDQVWNEAPMAQGMQHQV